MAHRRLDVARACMQRCLDLFDQLLRQGTTPIYWIAIIVLWAHRADVELFARTGEMSEWLNRLAGLCLMALTTDRNMGSLHALANHDLSNAPHAGAVHVAFLHRYTMH